MEKKLLSIHLGLSSPSCFYPSVSFFSILRDMTNITLSNQLNCYCSTGYGVLEHLSGGRLYYMVPFSGYSYLFNNSRNLMLRHGHYLARRFPESTRLLKPVYAGMVDDSMDPGDSEDLPEKKERSEGELGGVNSEMLRENLERIVGMDDSEFSGIDLATLIRKKYGRSYDVQLIKKEFMGRNLLALNVMWKYMEQRSFPLTEEEYLLRLDDVANTLKCWGAVSHIRNSLAKLKDRPRIGKAVSIFIDLDESGGRSAEWIYK